MKCPLTAGIVAAAALALIVAGIMFLKKWRKIST